MSNYTEADLIPFALQILNENPGGVDTSKLIENLRQKMQPSEHDLEILSNRNDDKFSQKVRNLKSHKTLENKNLAVFKDDKFFITEEGKKYLIKDDNQAEDINILENWELTTKTFNALRDQGIIYLSDLKEWPEKKLLTIPGFGKRGVEEIKSYLNKYNLAIINTNQTKTISNQEIPNIETESDAKTIELLNTNILRDWPLSVRTFNALKNENIIFLGDLLALDTSYLLKLRNFGRKSLREIKELLKKNEISKKELLSNFNLQNWFDQKFDLKLKEKNNNLNLKSLNSVSKSLLKDYNYFINNFFSKKKIIITDNLSPKTLENLIIEDIEKILSYLNDKAVILFKGRYGYKEKYKTLEEIGTKFDITRERVRQIEEKLNLAISKLTTIDTSTLISYFDKYDYVSFHKFFPKLDKLFSNTARGTQEITGDKLTAFIESYCGVKKDFFKTPERELWNFDSSKLEEIFKIVPSGIKENNFLEIIQENYGYNQFVSQSALEFMEMKKMITTKDQRIYPLKIDKTTEVTNILLNFPDGLHWKKVCEIGNASFSKNKWNPNRSVADHSLHMLHNEDIYLSERGTIKLFKFCREIKNKDEIISFFIRYLKNYNKNEIAMETVFKEIIKINKFKNLNFYDARAIIKKFGEDKGIYHSGPSGTNTISFDKHVKRISLKEKIIEIIKNTDGEIHYKEIKKRLQKTNESIPLLSQLNNLVDDMIIFRVSPGTFLNFEKAIVLCNKEKIKNFLDQVLNDYEFLTQGFIKEIIDNKFYYNFSIYYYSTLCKILSRENNWYYEINYLSKRNNKKIYLDEYLKNNYNMGFSSEENFENISKKIGITKRNFLNTIYKPDFKYNIKFTENYEH